MGIATTLTFESLLFTIVIVLAWIICCIIIIMICKTFYVAMNNKPESISWNSMCLCATIFILIFTVTLIAAVVWANYRSGEVNVQ